MENRISDERIAHMHGVAEWMYSHAHEFGCEEIKDEMYLLGLVHDIGYIYGHNDHEQRGAELLGEDSYYGKIVKAHGLTPQEYKDQNNCFDTEIPNEVVALWAADLMIDVDGKEVGFAERAKNIAVRYGADSPEFLKTKEKILWLENRKAIDFLTKSN